MKILLTNDDGISSPFLEECKNALEKYGEVFVSAPSKQKSGASVSLTIYRGVTFKKIDSHTIVVDGSPADSAVLGLDQFKDEGIDLVVSGVNQGYNESYDSLFSGTVGAGIAASLFGKKVLILSAQYEEKRVQERTEWILDYVFKHKLLDVAPILNINYPHRKYDEIKGAKAAHIVVFPCDEKFKYENEWAETYRPTLSTQDESDRLITQEGYYAITPLRPSFEDDELFEVLKEHIK